MSNPTTAEFGNTQALTHMMDSTRKGQLEVVYQGSPMEIVVVGDGAWSPLSMYKTRLSEMGYKKELKRANITTGSGYKEYVLDTNSK